jgi:hypothetical protein
MLAAEGAGVVVEEPRLDPRMLALPLLHLRREQWLLRLLRRLLLLPRMLPVALFHSLGVYFCK